MEPCRGRSAAARAWSPTGPSAAPCRDWVLAVPGAGGAARTPRRSADRSLGPSQPHCGTCSLSGGRETWKSSLMAGKHKENSINKGEGRELRALPIKNTSHKRRRARRGGEQGSYTAMLPACTEHVPGCPPCQDHQRGDREHRAPTSIILSCPAHTEADAGAIRQMLQHRGTVAPLMLGPLLRQPEPHQCPRDTPVSPLCSPCAAQVEGRATWQHAALWALLPLHPSPTACAMALVTTCTP